VVATLAAIELIELCRPYGVDVAARFTRKREDFVCGQCEAKVRGNGYTNHCPKCLWSRHVDVQPGDREAECQGMMQPVAALFERDGYVIVQKCQKCGHTWRNRASAADRTDVILALFGRPVEDRPSRSAGKRP
jgi:hypothetical protein